MSYGAPRRCADETGVVSIGPGGGARRLVSGRAARQKYAAPRGDTLEKAVAGLATQRNCLAQLSLRRSALIETIALVSWS